MDVRVLIKLPVAHEHNPPHQLIQMILNSSSSVRIRKLRRILTLAERRECFNRRRLSFKTEMIFEVGFRLMHGAFWEKILISNYSPTYFES